MCIETGSCLDLVNQDGIAIIFRVSVAKKLNYKTEGLSNP